jgi:hypothetical protein
MDIHMHFTTPIPRADFDSGKGKAVNAPAYPFKVEKTK